MTPTEKAAPIPALLPCPFCGALEDRLLCSVEGEDDYFNVGCEECDCRTAWFDSRAAAYTAWNRRADREARPSLPDSREERNEFNRGYLIAVANVMNMHKDAVVASELLMQLGVTTDDAEALGLTDYDMDALKRLRSEPRAAPFFKRKRRARARQGGNNG